MINLPNSTLHGCYFHNVHICNDEIFVFLTLKASNLPGDQVVFCHRQANSNITIFYEYYKASGQGSRASLCFGKFLIQITLGKIDTSV